MSVQGEDDGHNGGRDDADEHGWDDTSEPRQHEEDREDSQPDGECGTDSPVETEHKGLNLRTESLGIGGESEELGQLSDDDHQSEPVHVADLHLVREEIGDEPQPRHAEADLDERHDDREHAGEGDRLVGIASGHQERQQRREDHGRDRGVRAEDEDARRSEHRIAHKAHDGRVQPCDGWKASQLRVCHALGHKDGGEHDARDHVGPGPPALVRASDPKTRDPPADVHAPRRHTHPFASDSPCVRPVSNLQCV